MIFILISFRRTTDSRHNYALAANLLIAQSQTERVCATDIMFIPTSEGWFYVAEMMNVKRRKIIGLSMTDMLSYFWTQVRWERDRCLFR